MASVIIKKITWKLNLVLTIIYPWKFHMMTLFIRSVFEEDDKVYPQNFFRWCLVWIKHKRNASWSIFLKELMLIKQVDQKSVTFVAIGNLKKLVLGMNRIFPAVITKMQKNYEF